MSISCVSMNARAKAIRQELSFIQESSFRSLLQLPGRETLRARTIALMQGDVFGSTSNNGESERQRFSSSINHRQLTRPLYIVPQKPPDQPLRNVCMVLFGLVARVRGLQ
jgi:hypothetical protein